RRRKSGLGHQSTGGNAAIDRGDRQRGRGQSLYPHRWDPTRRLDRHRGGSPSKGVGSRGSLFRRRADGAARRGALKKMLRVNLSEWALNHSSFIRFVILAVFLAGGFAFVSLGRLEDPVFTFRNMVIKVFWPGASAAEVDEEITHRLETKLQDLP